MSDAIVTAFDLSGAAVGAPISLTGSFPGPMDDFSMPLVFEGLGPIGSIELDNPAGGVTYVDSFGFGAVPESSSLLTATVAFVAMLTMRRKWYTSIVRKCPNAFGTQRSPAEPP